MGGRGQRDGEIEDEENVCEVKARECNYPLAMENKVKGGSPKELDSRVRG